MPGERDPIDIAARALQHRDRSRRELDERLARAGLDETVRADALETLERVGYVDDERFAAARAEMLAGRGYGDEWIRLDLGTHGIEGDDAAAALAGLVPEADRARQAVARLGRSRKTASHLARKGFGEDTIESAVGADVADGAG